MKTAQERITNYKNKIKEMIPFSQKPLANHEYWKGSPNSLWNDLISLQDKCGMTTIEGPYIKKLKELPEESKNFLLDDIENYSWEDNLPFLLAMDSHICCSRVIHIAKNEQIEETIFIDLSQRIPGFMPAPLILFLEENSKAHVVIQTKGRVPMVESLRIVCHKNSNLQIDILENSSSTWAIFEQVILKEKAILKHTFLSLGKGLKRRDLILNLEGDESQVIAKSSYLGGENDHREFIVKQKHKGKNTISDVVEKGVAQGSAYNVLNGIIQIFPKASGSQAYLTNNNLLLNDGVRSYSIPRLEIEENDVKCSHSSTTSLLEPLQIFYLKTRGFSQGEAEKILVESFLEEPLLSSDNLLKEELHKSLLPF